MEQLLVKKRGHKLKRERGRQQTRGSGRRKKKKEKIYYYNLKICNIKKIPEKSTSLKTMIRTSQVSEIGHMIRGMQGKHPPHCGH